jgi:hypothetical protein
MDNVRTDSTQLDDDLREQAHDTANDVKGAKDKAGDSLRTPRTRRARSSATPRTS